MNNNLSKTQLDALCASRTAARQRGIGIGLALVAAILILPALLAFGYAGHASGHGAETLAGLGLLGAIGFGPILEKAGEESGGGADPLAKKILEKIENVAEVTKRLDAEIGSHDKVSKQLQEDLAKVAKDFDGMGSDVVKLTKTIGDLQARIALIKNDALGGSAEDRLKRNPELAAYADAVMRGYAIDAARKKGINLRMDEDKQKLFKSHLEHIHKLDTGNSPGSNMVDDELNTTFYSLVAEYGVFPMFDVQVAGKKTTKLITHDTDPVMVVVDEGSAGTDDTNPTGTTASATAAKVMGLVPVTNEMLEDAEFNVAGYLLPKFANAYAYRADFFGLAADATSAAADGGFEGCFKGGTALTLSSGKTTVQGATYTDWLTMLTTCSASVLTRPSARWTMHPQMLVRAMLLLDGNDRPIFQPSIAAPSFGAIGSILGFPVTLAHAAPNTNTAGKLVVNFGDTKGQSLLIRRNLEIAASEHVDFRKDQVVYRATGRLATKTRKALAFATMKTAAS